MQRISVTTIEKFRRFMAEASPFDTEESLIESLKGVFIGNDKTRFGSAFHKIIEDGFEKNFKQLQSGLLGQLVDNIFIPNTIIAPAYKYCDLHPNRVHEIAVQKTFDTAFGPIQVTSRIDVIKGACARDIKTKFRSVDFTEYAESCQWKFYLNILELDVFYYDLFEIKGFDKFEGDGIQILDNIEIIAHEPFQCLRYEDMDNDIHSLLNEFLEYLHNRNLVHLLKPALQEELLF